MDILQEPLQDIQQCVPRDLFDNGLYKRPFGTDSSTDRRGSSLYHPSLAISPKLEECPLVLHRTGRKGNP